MAQTELDRQVGAVRRFNRFYTKRIGILGDRLLDSPFSLTQVRVLYEIAHRDGPTAAELCRDLGLDAGYLSRILAGFVRQGLVVRRKSTEDARQHHLSLSEQGRAVLAPLERRQHEAIAALLAPMPAADRAGLADAMATVERLLDERPASGPAYELRPHRVGDLSWMVHRQAVLYAREYGWDAGFEALAAEVAAGFIRNFDPRREHCWIAERQGRIVGGVCVVNEGAQVARLRMLYVEPEARGLGIGARLVDECIRFARRAGYRQLILWTNDVLASARRIYQAAGFRLTAEERHHSFGHDLVGQTWTLDL